MNNEIKKIINDLQRVADRKCYPEDILDGSIAQEWVDYIINLQEENKELNDNNIFWSNRFKAVERDNRNLKAKLEMYENGVYFSSENDKLQERIDKAVEYIRKQTHDEDTGNYLGYSDLIDDEHLLNILQGSDKEWMKNN